MLSTIQGLKAVVFLVLACRATGISSPIVKAGDEDIGISNITEPNTAENTCFEAAFTPGCSDSVCEDQICENVDIFCCNRKWDDICVRAAIDEYADACQVGWPDQSNNCFEIDPFGRPGCDNDNRNETENENESINHAGYDHYLCESIICSLRPECCDLSYDEKCVELALKKCDLPDPRNSCIAVSGLPGCLEGNNDATCLESVCQKDETCCSVAYGPQCVELARGDSTSCAPKTAPNTCYEKSPFGGCADRRCQNNICTFGESCCNNQERIGRWDENCVKAAKALCQPVKVDLPSDGEDCQSGMICSYDSMANCTELASQYKDFFFLGNILGGVYCGDEAPERTGIINCPRGSYCPNPETILPCPAGYYCPFKTQEPTIPCKRCLEGSLQLTKDLYGWVVLCVIVVLAAAYIGGGLLNRYNKNIAYHISELEKRAQNKAANLRSSQTDALQQQKRDLEKLRPKIELINYRLAKIEGGQDATNNSKKPRFTSLGFVRDQIKFDAIRLFDVLDADASGDLTFDELNVILGLSDVELRSFIRRMNEMADSASTKVSITRPVFAKYFLQVLTDTSNLTISYEEAEAMFNELAGYNSLNDINMKTFYISSMSEFLSDSQIFELIKEFKKLDKGSNHRASTSSRRKSFIALRSSRRPSSIPIEIDSLVDNQNGYFKSSANASMHQMLQPRVKPMMIGRELFTQNYPQLLMDVMLGEDKESDDSIKRRDFRGVDISFKDLSLSIKLGKKTVDVVNKVTGRIRGKTMTALMGGSGAGKTSLLNALCGRAHYGETTGTIYLNGHDTNIQKHVDCIGFVPQDDIVYAELTVRENLIYAGRFRLPEGTTDEEIEELADETIANLGLTRVANNVVGDVERRGVSGGEKKRVNIGIELMAMPSILFLDEPTSGLDASSALLVMKSLNRLVEKDEMTVVSVIHQPRKFIYDLFDSLILLGVGGQLVYHGPTEGAEPYFGRLEYKLPKGESVADWLIDISSGRLEPSNTYSLNRAKKQDESFEERKEDCSSDRILSVSSIQSEEIQSAGLGMKSSRTPRTDSRTQKRKPAYHVFTDDNCVGKRGITTGKVVRAIEDSKIRTAWLCKEWLEYFNKLNDEQKSIYEPPEKYDLPIDTIKRSFWYQFIRQVNRAFLVSWRNRFTKTINCTIIVGSIALITAMDGVNRVSADKDPDLPFDLLVRPQKSELSKVFHDLFAYSHVQNIFNYPMKIGFILCMTVGLTATTTITSKRMEFFREAGSGYNLSAYFFAIYVLLTIESSMQVLIAAFFAAWIHNPIASHASYYIHSLLLAWLTVAWSMLFPMICSQDTVILVSGFFFAFGGLVVSGALSPFEYKQIYEEAGIKEFIAGWFSPTRFFYEAIMVGEFQCMPEQSGFTIESNSYGRLSSTTLIRIWGYAGHDVNAVRRSCNGWYWSVIPAIFIGITVRYLAFGAMHACFRAQQAKKPLIYAMKKDRSVAAVTILYLLGLVVLVSVTTWLFIRDHPFLENVALTRVQLLDEYGFFD